MKYGAGHVPMTEHEGSAMFIIGWLGFVSETRKHARGEQTLMGKVEVVFPCSFRVCLFRMCYVILVFGNVVGYIEAPQLIL